jgi:hypothetical protein
VNSILFFSIQTVSELLFLEDLAWDNHMAQKNFDFAGILQRLSEQYATG